MILALTPKAVIAFHEMKAIHLITLAVCICFLSSCTRSEFKTNKPNILVLLLDTLRADHMSGYGYERTTTPVLDTFARENLKAAKAMTAAPWTPASVATIFTGLYPASHGMMPPNDRDLAKQGLTRLSSNLETMAEILKNEGYKTAAVSPNPWIAKEFGYTQGFDQFFYLHRKPAETITESGQEIIDNWTKERSENPFFLYLHFLDPHDPYTPPGEYATKFSGPLSKSPFNYDERMLELIGRYDGEINYLDTELGKFFDYLKKNGLYEDLFIVIVSDHGEQFLEHGDQRHGYKLFNEEIHVPLLIRTGRAKDTGRVINETISTVDILPTIYSRLGLKIPENLQGVSLLDEDSVTKRKGIMSEVRRVYDMKSATDAEGKHLVMEVPYDQSNPDPKKSLEAWVSPNVVGLFDTRSDYACTAKITNPALEARLKGTFDEVHVNALKSMVAPGEKGPEIKDETLEQLKSLGYLQ